MRDATMERVLAQTTQSGTMAKAAELRRDAHAPTSTCLLHRDGACIGRSLMSVQPTPQPPRAMALSLMKL